MSWQAALEELYVLGARFMKPEGAEDGAGSGTASAGGASPPTAPSGDALTGAQTTLVRWYQKPGNIDSLLAACEQVRAEHRKLVAQMKRKRARGESYTADEMDRLVDLQQADALLAKEALLAASTPQQIFKYTVGIVLPWILLLGKLALLIVNAAGVPVAFNEHGTPGTRDAEDDVAEREEILLAALLGTRSPRELAEELGVSRQELLTMAARYSAAGCAALQKES